MAKRRQSSTSPFSIAFDCGAGINNWRYGWSDMKKAWCCTRINIPCPKSAARPASITAGVETHPPDTKPADVQAGCAGAYQQCGGKSWQGPKCCQRGCDCHPHGEYYSQCTPSGNAGTCAQSGPGRPTFMHQRQARKQRSGDESMPNGPRDELRALQRKSALLGLAAMAFAAAIVVGVVHLRAQRQSQEAEKVDSRSVQCTPRQGTEMDRLTVGTPATGVQDALSVAPATPTPDESTRKENKSSRTLRGTPAPSALRRGGLCGSRAAERQRGGATASSSAATA